MGNSTLYVEVTAFCLGVDISLFADSAKAEYNINIAVKIKFEIIFIIKSDCQMSSVQPIIFSVQVKIFKASYLSFTHWSREAIHRSLKWPRS